MLFVSSFPLFAWKLTRKIMAPLPWICLPLSHGQGYINQTSWLYSFPYSPESQFWRLFLKELKKLNVENLWWSLSNRQKSENFEIFYFFTNKPYFFKLNSSCTCSQLSFEVHNTLETQNFENFGFLYYNIYEGAEERCVRANRSNGKTACHEYQR